VLILPAHGATEEEIKTAETNFKKVVDTTCPLVLRTVHIIERLKKENYGIVIVGDKGHREVSVLSDTAGKNLIGIFRNKNEIQEKSFGKIGIVSQSTAFEEMLFSVTEKFLRYAKEVRFFNTVCDETLRRQKEAKNIAQTADCVLVIGGKTSANTNRLFELVKKINKNSFFIQNEKDVKSLDLSQCKTLGIVSGTSTPKWLIDKIIEEINKQ
jgi:4-hydroxy-3-methylbut-2-enyl diphosphate reductase